MTPPPMRGELASRLSSPGGCVVRVLVAARDVRVRRSLCRLLELDGDEIVGATDAPCLLPEQDGRFSPDLVVLELGRREISQDLQVVEELAGRGRAVIAVSSGSSPSAAALAAGARACLDKDARFADRLAEAIRAVAGPPTPPAERRPSVGQRNYVKGPPPSRSSDR
jgi:DNA-binding NarL/FixJ family response regulator